MIWEEGHDGIEYIKNLVSKVDIIKPSEVDAERIMTLGKDGAIVSDGTEILKFNTLATEIVDTTGAAFWSGFYTGITKSYTLKESLNLKFLTIKLKFRILTQW